MALEPWLYGGVLAMAVLHLLVAAYAWRDGEASAAGAVADGDALVCGDCGARNGQEYRFCRECVADLTAATAAQSRRRVGTAERGRP